MLSSHSVFLTPSVGSSPGVGLPALPPLSLYIHLPWCLKKCPYCDFNSHGLPAPGPSTANTNTKTLADDTAQAYIQALLLDLQAALPQVWGRPVCSVFMGGGTPSLFSPQSIDQLLAGVRALLPLQPGCEITLEANPGTFEKDRFAAYRAAGVTRLSLGVQSLNDAHLNALGRVHSAQQARAAMAEAASVFDTWNADLMYALPGQRLEDLEADLEAVLAFAPPHLSVYHLTVEPNTYFAKHPPVLPSDDLAAQMLDAITARTAQSGWGRYEVSAYAKPGHRCQHNLNYWQFGDYLGIGAGAHSKLSFPNKIIRQVRYRDPALYMAKAQDKQAMAQENEVSVQERPFEFMLNALRLKEGFPLRLFFEHTGLGRHALEPALEKAQQLGLLDLHEPHKGPQGHENHEGLQVDNAQSSPRQPNAQAPTWVRPTTRGFDFLNDLQALFLNLNGHV